jgi:putative transposase
VQLALPMTEILAAVNDTVEAVTAEAGLLVMKMLIDEEVEQAVSARYQRQAYRCGNENDQVVFAGRKVLLNRPRVRRRDGGEVRRKRYEQFHADGPMRRAVMPRIVAGVTTRRYEQTPDAVRDGYGIAKSSVSRHWQAAGAERLRAFQERSLGELDLLALVLDGIEFHASLLVVALGIDIPASRDKHVLGIWPVSVTVNYG